MTESNKYPATALLLEDDMIQGSLIIDLLPEFHFVHCKSLAEARAALRDNKVSFSLLLLDLHLPDGSAIELLADIRNDFQYRHVPLFIMTIDLSESTAVTGLSIGANDYIFKPIQPKIFRAKILNFLKFTKTDASTSVIEFGQCKIDVQGMTVINQTDKKKIALTPIEFKILLTLARNANKAMERKELHQAVWGSDIYLNSRAIDQHVATLRKKLGNDGKTYIHTAHGVGYIFKSEAPESITAVKD